MRVLGCTFVLGSAFVAMTQAQTPPGLSPPTNLTAGEAVTISSSGSGPATFYLIAPGHVAKRNIQPEDNIQISSDETATAGTYQAILCREKEQECASASFYVAPSRGKELVFLVRPAGVAMGEPNAISAVAVVVDRFQNLTLQQESVVFRATTKEASVSSP